VSGHALCTLMAVICGSLLAKYVSIKTVTVVGGLLFVLFSALTLLGVM
jgi:putative Ca2+/H+ antiporter (TMEM165/GDT1 family)